MRGSLCDPQTEQIMIVNSKPVLFFCLQQMCSRAIWARPEAQVNVLVSRTNRSAAVSFMNPSSTAKEPYTRPRLKNIESPVSICCLHNSWRHSWPAKFLFICPSPHARDKRQIVWTARDTLSRMKYSAGAQWETTLKTMLSEDCSWLVPKFEKWNEPHNS